MRPLPSHGQLANHPYREEFREAEKSHLKGHEQAESWAKVLRREAKGHKILGCHWVYTYKLDKHGRLTKFKARLVIRGDQQTRDPRETYAATLAGTSFKILIAAATRFNMELLQYDAVNAIVHAQIDETVFMEMPPGYQQKGYVLQLRKALYGLRRSPLLWQHHLEKGLYEIGFRRVAGENCCWQKGRVTFFFYVDDCVLAFLREDSNEAKNAIEALQQRYHLEGGQDLQWFLDIKIIRDRSNRKIWLSQAVYCEKASLGEQLSRQQSRPRQRRQSYLPYLARQRKRYLLAGLSLHFRYNCLSSRIPPQPLQSLTRNSLLYRYNATTYRLSG